MYNNNNNNSKKIYIGGTFSEFPSEVILTDHSAGYLPRTVVL